MERLIHLNMEKFTELLPHLHLALEERLLSISQLTALAAELIATYIEPPPPPTEPNKRRK